VGLVYYSVRKRAMGMAHIQLPSARVMHKDDKPSRFADAAPEFMANEMIAKYGLTKREILVSLFGGIDATNPNDCFRIGEKNLENVRIALKKLGMPYSEVDTGGRQSRTLIARNATGVVEVVKRPMNFQK
jgi:chemotaxis protein CheD